MITGGAVESIESGGDTGSWGTTGKGSDTDTDVQVSTEQGADDGANMTESNQESGSYTSSGGSEDDSTVYESTTETLGDGSLVTCGVVIESTTEGGGSLKPLQRPTPKQTSRQVRPARTGAGPWATSPKTTALRLGGLLSPTPTTRRARGRTRYRKHSASTARLRVATRAKASPNPRAIPPPKPAFPRTRSPTMGPNNWSALTD